MIEHWLDRASHRADVRFSKLYEKRAEVIAELYRRLSNIDLVLHSLPREQQQIDLDQHRRSVAVMFEEMKQAGLYYKNHAIYLNAPLKEKLEKHFKAIYVFWGITTVIADSFGGPELRPSRLKDEALNILLPGVVDAHRQVGPLLTDLEVEFRKILEG